MASVQMGAALRQIHGLFEAGTIAGLTDGQLLERYLTRRDESAFAALVVPARADGPGRLPRRLE